MTKLNAISNNIKESINKIIDNKDTLIFSYKHNIYRILYNEINYIEKEANVKRCIIHTNKENYYIRTSISKQEKMLSKTFIKTHQSCIINLDNVKEITKEGIKFYNGDETRLINRNMKNKLMELLKI